MAIEWRCDGCGELIDERQRLVEASVVNVERSGEQPKQLAKVVRQFHEGCSPIECLPPAAPAVAPPPPLAVE